MDFHVTIDFPDDLLGAEGEWSEKLLRELVRAYARRGVTALHWIDYGGAGDGMWDAGSYFDAGGVGSRFIERVPHPLRVVCDEAHKNGLRTYTVLKIFDLALGMPYTSSSPLGQGPTPPVGLPHVGGEGIWAARWLREYPHRRVCLHPALPVDDKPSLPIGTIRLWHETDVLSETSAIQIFTSTDNSTYQPYSGPMEISITSRHQRPPVFVPAPEKAFGEPGTFTCIELVGLDISEPFLCLKPSEPFNLANSLEALVDVEDTDGEAVSFTYGLVAMGNTAPPWQPELGIAFDVGRRTPVPGRGASGIQRSAGRIRVDFQQLGFLGLARGRNKYVTGVVELAYPEVRAWLVGMINDAIDAGVDGVDIRQNSHTECLDWENYGFGPPLIKEFQRRYGVDISTEPFDRAAWRRLRGEYFDLFLQEAAEALHSRQKQLLVHLIPGMESSADEPCFMEIFWDWRSWLRSGMVDQLTFKGVCEGPAVAECNRLGIPKIATSKMWRQKGDEFVDRVLKDGFEVFNIYESASVTRLKADGRLEFTNPSLWEKVAEVVND